MFARIDAETLKVVELWDVVELPPLHPDLNALYWQCGIDVQVGWNYDILSGLFSAPNPPAPEPISPEEFAILVESNLDEHVESVARSKGYGTATGEKCREFCLSYAAFISPYQAEAVAFGQWMASLWPIMWSVQAEYQSGTRALPATVDEAETQIASIIASLPEMVWPV